MELDARDSTELDDEALWLLLEEREWLDAEFEAIMRACGIVDGAAVAMSPRALGPSQAWTGRGLSQRDGEWRSSRVSNSAGIRVRSPPIP
ncbi:hypothetical protein WJX64_00565 [Leifsonia sp. YIM 134122]|uniref:Uncharacterized protein n=1 Tax=Leifsonia stereocauli TaxID=3134136 RepID=A0ABU9VZ43_9MICO